MFRVLIPALILISCSSSNPASAPEGERYVAEIRDDQYLSGSYFFLNTPHRSAFPDDPLSRDQVNVASVRVFLQGTSDLAATQHAASAFSEWDDAGHPLGSPDVSGTFMELDTGAYLVDARGYLILTGIRVSRGTSLAAVFATADGRRFGAVDAGQSTFRLIQKANQTAEDPTWSLAWRNVYSLGTGDLDPETLSIRVLRDQGDGTVDSLGGVPIAVLLGIDPGQFVVSPADLPGVNLALGHLVFPSAEPFAEDVLGPDGQNHAIYRADNEIPSLYRIRIEWFDSP